MSTSSGTKTGKKPDASLRDVADSKEIEQAVLSLENMCVRVLEGTFSSGKHDVDGLYWQRKFHNIITPVSLALAECKGPRHFHYHYKHSAKEEGVLTPVLEDPMAVLENVCRSALENCQHELVGIANDNITRLRTSVESALRGFLAARVLANY